jgi:hypothetical protein
MLILTGDILMFALRSVWRPVVVCGVALVASLGNGQAQAQYGGYGGFGLGWGLGPMTPASVNFLNDHAIARTHAAAAARPQPLRAPIPVSRDVDFFNRYDAATRAAMEDRVARRPRTRRAPVSQSVAQAAVDNPQSVPPIAPLASFFNAMRQIVWPSDSPTQGDLGVKRSASDAQTLELLKEIEGRGYAPVATAVEARNKLLDYGRPALQFMRENSAPVIADLFHSFLLSLYDSIGQTAELARR